MLFNSISYILFLPVVFFIYWFLFSKSLRAQNIFLFIVSYIFYAWWDWRFLFLLMLSTLIDYSFGLLVYQSTKRKKLFLWLSVANNLVVLFFFKYYNFFIESAVELAQHFGFKGDGPVLNILLPVGISFYTFHGMSYVFDIYNQKVKPTRNFIDYALFVSFFPLLVAGPIERAHHLLPQIQQKRTFNYQQAVEGMRLILWGFFKKIVIADTLAVTVNEIFAAYFQYPGSTLVLGVIFFSFQIYCDFSGYTDIALGSAKLFGIELLTNFRFPYFSRDIAEFWRRWHISLSSWFRDYLYIPLGGSRGGKWNALRNTFIIFIVSGFWHGANWTYLFWGFLHAAFFVPLLLLNTNRKHTTHIVAYNSKLPSLKEFGQMLLTFLLVTFAWIFFRSPTMGYAGEYLKGITHHFFTRPDYLNMLVYVLIFLVADWMQRKNERGVLNISNRTARYVVYFLMAVLILVHYHYIDQTEFIYFKF
jgi:alginate O-acetyltransferase complex protein AlgI